MDSTDEKIVHMLKENSRAPFVEIAKKLGVSEGTIRARVKKLTKNGELKFTIEDEKELKAVVLIATSTGAPTTKVANAIRDLGISGVYEVSGQFDIVCFVSSHEMIKINNAIEKIRHVNDVADTNTLMVLKQG